MNDQFEVLIPIDEVGRRLGISRPTIQRHVKAGVLPQPLKIGAATRWKLSAILAVMAKAKADAAKKAAA